MTLMHKIYNQKKHKIYTPEFPEKYVGQYPIICRSGWEYKFCRWLDLNENILKWASEPLHINYLDPVTNKMKKYYPDFLMQAQNQSGEIKTHLIEIKPYKQSVKPRNSKKKLQKQLMEEKLLYLRNQAKWITAENWCKKNGLQFTILTEKELFL